MDSFRMYKSAKKEPRDRVSYITINGRTFLANQIFINKAKKGGIFNGFEYTLHKRHSGKYEGNESFYTEWVFPMEMEGKC